MSTAAPISPDDHEDTGECNVDPGEISKILEFLALAERLKCELRHSWLSDGRQESVAEHTWQMALMAMLMHPHLDHEVDLAKTLKMILVHDLVEAISGDVPYFDDEARRHKPARERAAIQEIQTILGNRVGIEIHDLWFEFEHAQTPEAKFAQAIDKLEVQIQHNIADLEHWIPVEFELAFTKLQQPCLHDKFLTAFALSVEAQAETKLRAHGVDIDTVREKCGAEN
ncbi:MAG: HD domain-containing protein [Pseudomonadota bacterium]